MDPFLRVIRAQDLSVAPEIERLHDLNDAACYSGSCDITRGRGLFLRIALWLGRFPPEGRDVPVRVRMQRSGGKTIWTRDFGGHRMVSRLWHDPEHCGIYENFGPITVRMVLTSDAEGHLHIALDRMRIFGLPIPKALTPKSTSREFVTERGHFGFEIAARQPLLGPIIRYCGSLRPDPDQH